MISVSAPRPARDDDAAALANLWTDVYVRERLAPRLDRYSESEVRDLLAVAEGSVVEDADGHPAGAVLLARHGSRLASLTETAEEAQICLLAVAGIARRAGAGRLLLQWCADCAARDGLKRLVLWSRPSQESAHRLYDDLGYRRLPDWDPGDGVRLVYELRL